ncbi:GNAT family N-acetyltransferase [Nitrosomonas sp.]|uniref:GNAT family N-acetyltransferase n=1 Tax=Nitrosomonas sp. TaxID=42353 RepID=UPI0025CCF8D4|nr:GNAT family N-acetyltransferase [Nitrosomonas sp.]
MNIRPSEDSDVRTLANLFTESVHDLAVGHYDSKQRTAWAPQPPDLDYWHERLTSLHTLVAEIESQAAGFISYELNGHIDLLFISPGFVRLGIATALYSRAESILIKAGVTNIFTEASLSARAFFGRQGFHVTEEQSVSVRGALFRRFAMRKLLDSAQQGVAPDRYSAMLHNGR